MSEVAAIDHKRPTRMVVVGYLLSAVCLGLFFERAFGDLFATVRWNDANLVGDWTLSSVIGYLVAVAVAVGCYMHPRTHQLSYEVANELKKTTWPNVEDTRTSTIAVVLFSLISAGILGIFDFLSSKVMTQWIPYALDAIARHV